MSEPSEQLAALAHEQWAAWMEYLFENSISTQNGSIEIPAILVARWKRQVTTAYADLPEDEKESDRVQADKMLRIFRRNSISLP